MNKKLLLLLISTIITFTPIHAQISDLELLKKQTFTNTKYTNKRIVKFGFTQKNHSIFKYNPLSLTLSSLLFIYQTCLSPQLSVDCLYSPSCSEYTRQLFKRYGLIGGFITSADRLMRCDRISETTISPISVDDHDGKVHENTDRYVLKKLR